MPFEIEAPKINIPPGTYPAVLESVNEPAEPGRFGKFREWFWLVEVGDKVESLKTFTSANTSLNSESYKYLTALLGKAPQIGERIEDPTGTRVLLQIIANDKGYPKIEAVLPYTEPQQVMPGVPR